MHGVLTTPTFERQATAAGLTDDEIVEICSRLGENPQSGALMAGTGGARKTRFARSGKGKSGGFRVVHYYGGDDVPVFVLALVNKSSRANLTRSERNTLAQIVPRIADAYRAGVKATTTGRRPK